MRKTHPGLSQCHPIRASKTVLPHGGDYISLASVARKHGQRRGSNLEIISERRKGKPRAWVSGSQIATKMLWLPIPTWKSSRCDNSQSAHLCLDLNQTNTDSENFLHSKRKRATGSSKLTKDLTIANLFHPADTLVSLHWWAVGQSFKADKMCHVVRTTDMSTHRW